jgi:asparagine synthase (glutamine-hydrolysing)
MPEQQAQAVLADMCRASVETGTHVFETWRDEALGLYVGWARVGREARCTPWVVERGDTILVFAGEDFSEGDDLLGAQRGSMDGIASERALGSGRDLLRGINGWFHGLVARRSDGTVTVFNDRYGMRRLYYRQSSEAFLFAANAGAILAVIPRRDRAVDFQGLAEFAALGYVLEDRSVFKDVHLLPPASAWTFRKARCLSRRAYFVPSEWEEQGELSSEKYYEVLREVVRRRTPRYLSAAEGVGISLSGGLDSRLILAWSGQEHARVSYTFGGMYRESRDVMIARQVADACGVPHHVITVGAEFLSQFPCLAERTVYLSDGSVGVNHAPDLYVNERARRFAPVRVTGNYGGEVLRGLPAVGASVVCGVP